MLKQIIKTNIILIINNVRNFMNKLKLILLLAIVKLLIKNNLFEKKLVVNVFIVLKMVIVDVNIIIKIVLFNVLILINFVFQKYKLHFHQ